MSSLGNHGPAVDPSPPQRTRRTCKGKDCNRQISCASLDPHNLCVKCRGHVCALDNRCEECLAWDDETLLKACKHQRQLEVKRKSYGKKRSSALHSSCSSPGVVDYEVEGEVLEGSAVSSPSSMDPGPSASQVGPPVQDFQTQMSNMMTIMSQFSTFLGMAGVNEPTTLREVVKEVVEEAVPNYLSVAAPPLVTTVTSGAPSTPGDRELTLVR